MVVPELVWEHLTNSLQSDPFWRTYWPSRKRGPAVDPGLHLGVFVEPFLTYLLDGKKTIESRFSARRFAPYQQVKEGDILLIKTSGGPIVGVCQIVHVWYYELDPPSWSEIKNRFADAICAEGTEFWTSRERAAYATLLQVTNVLAIEPIAFPKRDRRGWVVLNEKNGGG